MNQKANDLVRRYQREGHNRLSQPYKLTTPTQPTISLSNFRVTYHAPRYEDGKVLYDGYCAILADDAALDGAEVRVFDVPDVDEGQLAAALFACDAMNQHTRLVEALQDARQVFVPQKGGPSIRKDTLLVKIDAALATTTSK